MSSYFTKPFNPIDWQGSPHDFTGDNQLGPYTVESTQRYVYGTRYLTWDGRVYKYYNAEAPTFPSNAAQRVPGASACSVYVNAGTVTQIGDRSLLWTTQGAARVEDDLAGGHIIIYDKLPSDVASNRSIVGNDASSGTTTKLYLEYSLEFAIEITTPDAMEVYENPYSDLQRAAAGYQYTPFMGLPTRSAAAGQKGWIQTWGKAVMQPESGVPAPGANQRELVFTEYGTAALDADFNATGYQRAGHILTVGTACYGPYIMLQCST